VLFWFRYAALATLVFGLSLAYQGVPRAGEDLAKGGGAIAIGMWLALIMAFNV